MIEHIAEILYGPQCDDPQYVENLLGHSWENGVVFFGDDMIDTTEMTVLLTVIPEYQDEVGVKCRVDSYAWISDFDKTLDEIWKPEC